LTAEQAHFMKNRPFLEKLGAAPNAKIVAPVAGGFKSLLASFWVTKVLVYYGSLIDPEKGQFLATPEYYNLYKTIESSTYIDPYNADSYYFAQATFTWELGRIKEVNSLLVYGMNYRSWDYLLPFYAGFNNAYFLQDYEDAALLMKIAAERSGSSLFTKLASRYFYQSSQTDFGIRFLQSVIDQTKNERLRSVYQIRLNALQQVSQLEAAVILYHNSTGLLPSDLSQLVEGKLIESIPLDPYGGTFYIDREGRVVSTSKFSFTSSSDNGDEIQ
jgi:hypothetical protein